MGCDIHAYVEYSDFDTDDGPYWSNFTTNNGSRNYVMFGVLAGVRVPEAKLFDPKGMPDDRLGYGTSEDYWLHVAPDKSPDLIDHDGWTSKDSAERWVRDGLSVADLRDDGSIARVSGPDWHSHSWLTLEELEQALVHYALVVKNYWPANGEIPAEWMATVAAMSAFRDAGKKTRLIFWFDN